MGMEAPSAMAASNLQLQLQQQHQQQQQLSQGAYPRAHAGAQQPLPSSQNSMYANMGGGPMSAAFSGQPRQGSIYSLTLDEFQNAISEPGQKQNVGSMNMDEFLKNVWTAEETQAMMAAYATGADQQQMGLVRQASMEKQNSLTMPQGLSRKTVDEVWRDISGVGDHNRPGEQQRQMTFGEMSLEDFLLRAGVVREDLGATNLPSLAASFNHSQPAPGGQNTKEEMRTTQAAPQSTLEAIQNAANQQQAEWMNYRMNTSAAAAMAHQHQTQQQQALRQQAAQAAAAFVTAHKRATVAPPLTIARPMLDNLSPVSPGHQGNGVTTALVVAQPDPPGRGKKRGAEVVEKVVERRQRRMIKNRESAARSRARKQAYTVELEAEVMELKDENKKLRELQEREVEERRKLILEVLDPVARQGPGLSSKPSSPRQDLRRVSTGPW